MVEGSSINGTVRMTGVAKNTILKLLAELGSACLDYQDANLRNLNLRYIECDEIWEFCYAKEKNVPAEHKGEFGYGDVWTWTGIDADTKLVVQIFVLMGRVTSRSLKLVKRQSTRSRLR